MGNCILAKKNYFTTKEPKKHVLLEKLRLKLNFLQLYLTGINTSWL